MSRLAQYINQHIVGTVFDAPTVCSHYSTDGSILQYSPRLVAFPKTTQDVRKLLRFSNQLAGKGYQLPVTLRGTGLDKTGAAIGQGIIISTSKLNQIEEIDVRGRLVRVQPGITVEKLNQALNLHGLWLPVSCSPSTTIGGLIANYTKSNLGTNYGDIDRYVERLEVVLASGDLLQIAHYSNHVIRQVIKSNSREGVLYRQLARILNDHEDTIQTIVGRPSNRSGYANITHINYARHWDLSPLFFASQGTLGAITDVILRLEILSSARKRLAIIFHDLHSAIDVMDTISMLNPRSIQIADLKIAELADQQGIKPNIFTRKIGKGWLVIVEFDGSKFKVARKIHQAVKQLPAHLRFIVEDSSNQDDFSKFNSMLLGYANPNVGERSPIVDDVFIPPDQLPKFIDELKVLEQTLGVELPLYGSYLRANYQVRPVIDYSELDGRQLAVNFLRKYSRLVNDCGGSITGGSPEGRIKTPLISRTTCVEERMLYAAIKDAFDPYHILNPGVKLDADMTNLFHHLRTTPRQGLTNLY